MTQPKIPNAQATKYAVIKRCVSCFQVTSWENKTCPGCNKLFIGPANEGEVNFKNIEQQPEEENKEQEDEEYDKD